MGKISGRALHWPLSERQKSGYGLAVLVGDAPARNERDDSPLIGRTGRALSKIVGVGYPSEFATVFDRATILLSDAPLVADSSVASSLLRCRANSLGEKLRGRVVVFLGARAASAFDLNVPRYSWEWVWREGRPGTWVSLPDSKTPRALDERRKAIAWLDSRGAFLACIVPRPLRTLRMARDPDSLEVDRAFWRTSLSRLRASARVGRASPVAPPEVPGTKVDIWFGFTEGLREVPWPTGGFPGIVSE